MIHLFTGTPGSSKTLNVLQFVNESEKFKNRPVYYFNIKEVKLPWTELSQDEVTRWFDLPEGAVIVIDEVQKIMPLRKAGSPVPDHIQNLDTHRHNGYDLILVTQHPMLLDTFARRMVGEHTHIARQFGMESAKHYSWQKCQNDPDDYHVKQEAIVNRKAFNKKYYGLYKSAEVHTHKRKIPFKVFIPIIALLPIGYAIASVVDRFSPDPEVVLPESIERVVVDTTDQIPVATNFDFAYVDENTPRIDDVPWTAPIYDEIAKPKSFPRPQCYMWESGPKKGDCKCLSQQATALAISHSACVRYVQNGYFNPFLEDTALHSNPATEYAERQKMEAAAPVLERRRSVLLSHTPRPSKYVELRRAAESGSQ